MKVPGKCPRVDRVLRLLMMACLGANSAEVITLDDTGQSGIHFDDLYQAFQLAKKKASKDFVIDVVGEEGRAYPDDIAEAIIIAVNKGADVINISLAVEQPSLELEKAILVAAENNVVVVAATQSGLEKVPSYPASFDNVLGVYPLRSTTEEYWYSNSVGASVGVVVPSGGGSSLAGALVTAELVNCLVDYSLPLEAVVSYLVACGKNIDLVQMK